MPSFASYSAVSRLAPPSIIDEKGLAFLFEVLREGGYAVVGPTVRDGAIVLDELSSPDDLPVGVADRQEAGAYALSERRDRAVFGQAVGPDSWRRFLSPPRELLWRASRSDDGFRVEDSEEHDSDLPARYAFVGVRGCDLRAIEIRDLVLGQARTPDPRYNSRRAATLVIAVNCTDPAGTCFCLSMGTGPRVRSGFDLAFTEITGDSHRFLVEVGTEAGREILAPVPSRPVTPADLAEADTLLDNAANHMGRVMDTSNLKDLLAGAPDHPRWSAVAERCLACGNCTLVCPTCFCSTVEDTTDLAGEHAERWQRWDSCFTGEFSFLHGGSVRPSIRARYRQWLTHKLGTWWDQFGSSGCVGCGRCITWCPVGIDLTEEVDALRTPATRASLEPVR